MSLRRIQTCEQCGAARDLGTEETAETGGWRTLNAGGMTATFCIACIRELVAAAIANAEAREG